MGSKVGRAKKSSSSTEQQIGLLPLETRLAVDPLEGPAINDAPDQSRLIVGPIMLPMPPSANRYWKIIMLPVKGLKWPLHIANVRDIWRCFRSMNKLSDDAENYKKDLMERVLTWSPRPRMTSSPLCVEIVVCFGTNARQDIDNRVKPLLDAFTAAGLMEDDSQVVDLRVRRGPVIKEGRVVVRIWEVVPNFDRALYSTGWGRIQPPINPPVGA